MQGLKRLTQVMTRGGEKARFRRISPLRLLLGLNKGTLHALSLSDVRKRDDDTLDPTILSAVGQYATIVPTTVPTFDLSLDRREGFQYCSSIQQQCVVGVEQLKACDRLTDVVGAETE